MTNLNKYFLLTSGIIQLLFLPTSGLFWKDDTHIDRVMPLLIKICMNNAVYNSNTYLRYKLFRNTFYLDTRCNLTREIPLIRSIHLDVKEKAIVNTLIACIDVRDGLPSY